MLGPALFLTLNFNTMRYYKLSPGVNCFYDLGSKFFISKGMVVMVTKNPSTRQFKQALTNKVLVSATELEYLQTNNLPIPEVPKPEPVEPEPGIPPDPLLSLSRAKILAKYSYLDSEDMATAKAQTTVPELVSFLRKIEKEYN